LDKSLIDSNVISLNDNSKKKRKRHNTTNKKTKIEKKPKKNEIIKNKKLNIKIEKTELKNFKINISKKYKLNKKKIEQKNSFEMLTIFNIYFETKKNLDLNLIIKFDFEKIKNNINNKLNHLIFMELSSEEIKIIILKKIDENKTIKTIRNLDSYFIHIFRKKKGEFSEDNLKSLLKPNSTKNLKFRTKTIFDLKIEDNFFDITFDLIDNIITNLDEVSKILNSEEPEIKINDSNLGNFIKLIE